MPRDIRTLLAALSVAGSIIVISAHEAKTLTQNVYRDTKNGYFSMLPPIGWVREDYEDPRTKVAWREPSDQRVLLRVIAREARESHAQLKEKASAYAAQLSERGVTLRESEIMLGHTPAVSLEGDIPGLGTTRLLFFLVDDIHFNCQYAAPTRALYDKHAATAMAALSSIITLPERIKDVGKRSKQELAWYRRYSYLLEQWGDIAGAKAVAEEGLKKFPNDSELQRRAGK